MIHVISFWFQQLVKIKQLSISNTMVILEKCLKYMNHFYIDLGGVEGGETWSKIQSIKYFKSKRKIFSQ